MNSDAVISLRGLTRYFGDKCAVYELNLDVPKGGVFAFLGRNGSGKTTTIRMALGLLQPNRGKGTLLGCDILNLTPSIRARVGYMTEDHQLFRWMSVQQCHEFQKAFYPRWNDKIFQGVIEHFGLKMETKVKELSRGERAGLALAITLAPDPELLILDDPALGLDPVARGSLIESMIYLTRRADRTIFFSSHDLGAVERVADHVAILDRSELRVSCSMETFHSQVHQVRLKFNGAPPRLPSMPGMLQAFRYESELRVVFVRYSEEARNALQGLHPVSMEPSPLSLHDSLVSYMGDHREKSFIMSDLEVES